MAAAQYFLVLLGVCCLLYTTAAHECTKFEAGLRTSIVKPYQRTAIDVGEADVRLALPQVCAVRAGIAAYACDDVRPDIYMVNENVLAVHRRGSLLQNEFVDITAFCQP